jgi:phytol kinase
MYHENARHLMLNIHSLLLTWMLFYSKGAISKDAQDSEVQTLSRSSSPSELLFGPLQFAAVLACCGLFCFMTTEAAIVMATIGIGDAMAPIVGSLYGRHLYRVLPILGPTKTMEGSVCGVFLGTCMGIYFFLYALGLPQTLPLRVVLVYAAMAAVVEGTSPGNMDNLAVPIVLHLFMDRVPQWLP